MFLQAPPPPYYTVGLENKRMEGSIDNGIDEPDKSALYGSQQYHSYNHNGHVNNIGNNNGKYTNLLYNSNSFFFF